MFWNFLDRMIGRISFAAAIASVLGLAVVAVAVISEVLTRLLAGGATIWSNEIAIYGVIAIAFLAAGHVLRINSHLEVDLVTNRLGVRVRNGLGFVTDIASAIFCAIVVYSGINFVELSHILGAVSVGELRIPLWIPQAIIPISFLILTLEFLARSLVRLGLVRREIETPDPVAHPVLPT